MKKEKILIVEDEQDCAELLQYHLHKENYQTEVARDGKEALDVARRWMPDAVLLDIMLPEMSGWEVCRILREEPQGQSLLIIMLTALSEEEQRIHGLLYGADDYVSKPYSMQELLLKLRKQLDRQRTIRQVSVREQEHHTALRYMVHELKNSLTAIGGFSTRALKHDNTNKYLKTINSAARHAENLLKDASLLTRIERGDERLTTEQVDIDELVGEVIELVQSEIRDKDVEMIVMNRSISRVWGNRTAISQILINLISNAVKYNRDGGKVWIRFDETNIAVDISVKDEGHGIERDDLDRIFDKFYRTAESRKEKGAGLGLYIVKHLADAMGGKVTVTSQPEAGSTFRVSFIKAESADFQSTPVMDRKDPHEIDKHA